MRRLAAILAALALPLVVLVPMSSAATPTLTYGAHVANIGWLPDVASPATAGTTGQSRQMEALRIAGGTFGSDLSYRAHVANIGWMAWVGPAFTAGTTGQARQLEAVQVRLSGASALTYSVECRAHVASLGWLPWVRDGSTCGTTGQGRRAEAVQLRLVARTTPTATPTATSTPSTTTAPAADLAVTGDTGIDDPAAAQVLAGMARARTALIVGDLAYDPAREAEYCAFVKAKIPAGAQLLPGNHEAQDGDGVFGAYAACLPDLWGVSGSYTEGHWYADRGNMRLIGIAPNIALPSGTRTYARGTPEREQLKDWIDEAKAAGRWVIVSMHMPCLTVGAHGCASDPTITDMLIGKSVDLILSGHDHNYSRSHQISGTAAAPVVVDRDGTFAAGAGSVLVTVGAGGHNARTVASPLPAWAATASGTNSPGGIAFGHLEITATPTALTARYVADAGNTAYSDSFVVAR
ncbi:MAG: metallophosphoesterase [Propionivibrio sp.]|nr:metallophosphoesterase [Propionivibrio sp.]